MGGIIMKLSFVFASLLFGIYVHAWPSTSVNERPLRVLNPGSEIYIQVDGDVLPGSAYQNGKSVFPGSTEFDEKSPFCIVDDISMIPEFAAKMEPLLLTDSEGSLYDESPGPDFLSSKFISKITFSNNKGFVGLTCMKESDDVFNEITLGEFESVFKGQLRFGSLSLSDSGIEVNSPLYSEYQVLTPQLLRESILLSTTQDLSLKVDKGYYAIDIVNGQIVENHDFSKGHCRFLVIETPTLDESAIVIPANTKFAFGTVSGSYKKMEGIDFGFNLLADLSGFQKPVKLSCSSIDSAKPLRYREVRQITLPLLDWAYSF